MSQGHRRAPDPEWVEMYRGGISATSIAKYAGAGASKVGYHIQLEAESDPALRDHHRAVKEITKPSRTGHSDVAIAAAAGCGRGHGRTQIPGGPSRHAGLGTANTQSQR